MVDGWSYTSGYYARFLRYPQCCGSASLSPTAGIRDGSKFGRKSAGSSVSTVWTTVEPRFYISNSVNSKSRLFWIKAESRSFDRHLVLLGYFEIPLFRAIFRVPWDFEMARFDCRCMFLFSQFFEIISKKCSIALHLFGLPEIKGFFY